MSHRRIVRAVLAIAGLFVALSSAVAASSTASAGPNRTQFAFLGTQDFAYTGAPQDWTVPAGITSIVAAVCGASGENMMLADSPGIKFAGRPGHGGCSTATVAVTPGDVVHVRVGGFPVDATSLSSKGWPDGGTMTCPGIICGGGGGGSSDIRIGGDTLADRVIVGGGGGGGGGGDLGGAGGNAGGGTGTLGFEGESGGTGAGLPDVPLRATGGGGGQLVQTWNGGCGVVDAAASPNPQCVKMQQPNWQYVPGQRGVDNNGGDSSIVADGDVGGAGGGGYFGGGSGCGYHGSINAVNMGACGGGGGSSYADPARTTDAFLEQGTTQWYLDFVAGITTDGDNGTVSISWPAPEVPVVTAPADPTTTMVAVTTNPSGAGVILPATGSSSSGLPLALGTLAFGAALAVLARRGARSS